MSFMKPIFYSIWLIAVILMPACSSHVPPEISLAPENAPDVAQVQADADSYLTQQVRWGGTILKTENKDKASWLTIIAFPLREDGEPRASDHSPGRFIAIIDEFLEPLVYSPDRQITVTGKLIRTEKHKVGEFLYQYPVVQVEHYYLWPLPPVPTASDYPPYGWYDPWYHPYDPWFHPHH